MTLRVDARGLACPQPVILTRDAMQQSEFVMTIVDSETARRNVERMAQTAGATVEVERLESGIHLHIRRGPGQREGDAAFDAERAPESLVLVVSSERMGRGEHDELGQILMRGFFHTLGEVQPVPGTVIFLNSGVKLVVAASPVAEDLRALSERGVTVLACGTCLGYYELSEQVVVGEISNMYTIAETMLSAGKLISL